MGNEIVLGIDYSTVISRKDKPEYYEEIEEQNQDDVEAKDR